MPALRGLALWPPRLDRVQLRRIVAFSLPLIAFAASQYGMRSVDIVVLRAFGTARDVGIYALAYQSYTTLQSLAVTATIVLIPLFVSLREAGREELVARYFERLVPQAILAVSVAGGLLAPIVVLAVPVVFGADFEDAGRPLALLVAALALFSVASLLAPILMLHERTRETSVINVAALALNVAGDVVLIGVLDAGVAGPAIATIAALALIVAGYVVVARRDLGRGPALSPLLALPLAAGILVPLLLGGAAGIAAGIGATAAATALVLLAPGAVLLAGRRPRRAARPAGSRFARGRRRRSGALRATEPQRVLPARRDGVGRMLARHVGAAARSDRRLPLARLPRRRGELRETIERPAGDRPQAVALDDRVRIVRERERRHARAPSPRGTRSASPPSPRC